MRQEFERREENRAVDPIALGKVLAESGYFQDAQSAAQAAVKVLAGQELGLGPVASMTGVHIIQGKPSVGSQLLAALVKGSRKYDYRIREHTSELCRIEFFELGKSVGFSDFTMEDAKLAGTAQKDNWRKTPRNMLFARALSNGVRFYCPDLTGGAPVYVPEEGTEVDPETGALVSLGEEAATPEPTPVATKAAKPDRSAPGAITAAQRRKFFAECKKADLTDEGQQKALIAWLTGEEHTDRIPSDRFDEVLAAIPDWQATFSAIVDAANDEAHPDHERAKKIGAKFYPEALFGQPGGEA
jgi:hypothetical protein